MEQLREYSKHSFKIESLDEGIKDNDVNKNVCVFGQGFVGLPLALSFSMRGCNAIGVDVNKSLVNEINNGITYHAEEFCGIPIQEILKSQLKLEKYVASSLSEEVVKKCNNIIVTVGIPIVNGQPVMNYLESACKVISRNLKREDLVIIRSTVIPGTTEEIVLPILEQESGMRAGTDFYLAYASERVAEGKAFDEFANMPTLVAGVNKMSTYRASNLLGVVCKAGIVEASNIKAVETSKVFENVQRDVNIAMVQEFARFTEAFGIDIFEVIKLANTHKRVNLLTPGPGVGGFCIPNAYHYISAKAKELEVAVDILELCRNKNASLPCFIVDKTEELLKKAGKDPNSCKIAVLGLAMKDYSNDDRISPPVDICKLFMERGYIVKAYDPIVSTRYDFKVSNQEDALKDADAVLVLTKQKDIVFDNYLYISKIMNSNPVYIDTKAVASDTEAIKHGFIYWRI